MTTFMYLYKDLEDKDRDEKLYGLVKTKEEC